MAEPQDSYEQAISRVTKLEVDFASAVSSLKQSQVDNDALIQSQTELLGSHKHLQSQHDKLLRELQKEREERQNTEDERDQQVSFWRAQFDAKTKELEDVRSTRPKALELETMKFQMAEELSSPHRQQVQELEARISAETLRTDEAKRAINALRLEHEQRLTEAQEKASSERQSQEFHVQDLQSKITALMTELSEQRKEAESALSSLARSDELEANLVALRQMMQEQELRLTSDRKALSDELTARSEELSNAQRHVRNLQTDLEHCEREREHAVSEAEGLKRENARLSAQLNEAHSQLAATKPIDDPAQLREDIDRLWRSSLLEQQRLQQLLQTKVEQLHSANASLRRAEARVTELEEEMDEREHGFREELQGTERSTACEVSRVREEVERLNKDAESRRLVWRQREAELLRSVGEERTRADSLSEELVQCQFADKEMDKRVNELRQKYQQQESAASADFQKQQACAQVDLAALRETVERLQQERKKQSTTLEEVSVRLRKEEKRSDVLQSEVDCLRQQLDASSAQAAHAADDAHAAATAALEEECRKREQLMIDYKSQLAKHEALSKHALQKGARKRHELRQKCQELAKRVLQLQQEKATVLRVSDESKAACDLRFTELAEAMRLSHRTEPTAPPALGAAVSTLASATGADGMMQRGEYYGILQRLEQSAARLQKNH